MVRIYPLSLGFLKNTIVTVEALWPIYGQRVLVR